MTAALAIMLGLAYVASPGPVNIATLRRGLLGGFRVALALQLGSLSGDLFWAILALAGVGLLLTHAAAQTVLGIAGTALLVYLGCSALRSWRTIAVAASPAGDTTLRTQPAALASWRMVWTGAAIATANPFGPAFWLSIGGALSGSFQQQPVTFVGGFFLGALLAGVTIANSRQRQPTPTHHHSFGNEVWRWRGCVPWYAHNSTTHPTDIQSRASIELFLRE